MSEQPLGVNEVMALVKRYGTALRRFERAPVASAIETEWLDTACALENQLHAELEKLARNHD